MRSLLAATAVLVLSASGAFAMCGHDSVQSESKQNVATLDMSTTASTTVDTEGEPETPAEAD